MLCRAPFKLFGMVISSYSMSLKSISKPFVRCHKQVFLYIRRILSVRCCFVCTCIGTLHKINIPMQRLMMFWSAIALKTHAYLYNCGHSKYLPLLRIFTWWIFENLVVGIDCTSPASLFKKQIHQWPCLLFSTVMEYLKPNSIISGIAWCFNFQLLHIFCTSLSTSRLCLLITFYFKF